MKKIHPEFTLNDIVFSTSNDLLQLAQQWISEEGEKRFIGEFILEWLNSEDFIKVQTSGSTGKPKVIRLQKKHVENSAKATISFFSLKPGTTALLCLSSQYIAGKMMLVRAMIGGWKLTAVEPKQNPLKNPKTTFDFTAMVPFQVFHSLEDLYKVNKIIIGGGVVPVNLEKRLQQEKTLAFATYGMTETISHIAVRQINGAEKSSVYSALPDVEFSQNQEKCLQIHAPKIAEEVQQTNDVVELISPEKFRFLGRLDHVINSGGIKIYPEEIERKLSEGIKKPFFIASEADDALGERIILVIESSKPLDFPDFQEAFSALSVYEKPKKIYSIPKFIYTETEKIKRGEVLKQIQN